MSSWVRKISWKEDKRLILMLLGAILLVLLDAGSKWLIQCLVKEGEQIAVIPNFFYITKSYNVAVAFSIGSNLPMGVGRAINISISLIMSVAIAWFWIKNDPKLKPMERVCLMLMLGGAVGNLIDRAFYWDATTGFNGVIDFLQFYLGGGPSKAQTAIPVNPFATFNLADSYLTIGIVLLLIYFVIEMVQESKAKKEFAADPRLGEKKDGEEEKK